MKPLTCNATRRLLQAYWEWHRDPRFTVPVRY